VPLTFAVAWYGWNDAWPAPWPAENTTGKNWILPGLLVGSLGWVAPRCLPVQVFLAWVAAEVVVGAGHALSMAQVEGDVLPIELGMKVGLVAVAVSLAAAARRPGVEPPLLALIGLVGAAAAVAHGGWAQGALLLAAVGLPVGGTMVVGAWRRTWSPLLGAGLAVGIGTGGVLLVGYRLAETPLASVLLAAAAPMAIWIPGRRWWWTVLRLGIAAAVAYGAYMLSAPPPNPYSGSY
jgi:hypothetical protein